MNKKHGLRYHTAYYIWKNMRQRCYNKNHNQFADYGGRGIVVCEEWHDVVNFINWAESNGYSKGLHLDRMDNDGNYSTENCRFVTSTENVATGRRRKFKSNTTGFIGVTYHKRDSRYQATASLNNKVVYIGYFKTPEEARKARIEYEIKTFGEQKTFD